MSPSTILSRKFVAIAAASLLVAAPSRAKVMPLGIVTHAERAHVDGVEVSVGSTIYDGDRLSTDIGGFLRISSIAFTLQLDPRSSVILRRAATPEAYVRAEVGSGTITFSSGQASNIAVLADDALIRSIGHASTMARISVISQKELRIHAQRGALNFSYHGDNQTVPEGAKYRVLLDPSEREVAAASESDNGRKDAIKLPKFILIAIGFMGGITIPLVIHALESPESP